MHRGAYHFIQALGIPSLSKTKKSLGKTPNAVNDKDDGDEEEEEEDNDDDVDVSMEIDASADDVAAIEDLTLTNFESGDAIGKCLAFVNQARMSSDVVCNYLSHLCVVNGLKPLELRTWVQTRWGSLGHCLKGLLSIQQVLETHFLDFS